MLLLSGLAGFYLVEDPLDSERLLDLPESDYDIPLLLQNKIVEINGNIHENTGDNDTTTVAGLICVNGKVSEFKICSLVLVMSHLIAFSCFFHRHGLIFQLRELCIGSVC